MALARSRSPGRTVQRAENRRPQTSSEQAEGVGSSHDSLPTRSLYFGGYLSEHAAKGIREYKYAGYDKSLFLTYVSNPIYNRIVLLFPLWLAPNIITLCGLMCTVSTYVVFHYYCPFLYGVAPWWAYVMNALAILGYQALDAMDGKQARRTGSGSPLGLLFDHGCDAFNGTIMSLTMSSVAQTGPGLVSFAMWVSATTVFFCATVEEFYTGEMRLGIINGPNEGLLIAVVCNLITAAIGPGFWNTASPVFGLNWNILLLILSWTCGIFTKIDNWARIAHTIYCRRRTKTSQWRLYPELGKFNYFVAFSRFLPFVVLCALFFTWIAVSPSNIMQRHPRVMSWVMGFLFCKLVTALMVSHITNDEYHPMGKTVWLVLGVMSQALIQFFWDDKSVTFGNLVSLQALIESWKGGRDLNMQGLPKVPPSAALFELPQAWTQEEFLLYQLLVITGVSYFHYIIRVVLEVSDILDIKCFTIPYPNIGCKMKGMLPPSPNKKLKGGLSK